MDLARQKVEAEKADLQKQLGQYTGQATAMAKQIEDLQSEQTRLAKRLNVIAPNFKDKIRNAPLMDFMAPTIKVQQIILPNVVDDVNFIRVYKMDRCTTCHLAIDKKGYEKYPQPFTTHPNLDQYIGSSSPHPIDRVGCTVCHEGSGQSISFRDASHMPSNEKQKEEWEQKYPLGGAAPVGLPDAAGEDDRGVVREVPQAERLHPEGRCAEHRLRDLRARGLLRVSQDEGLRHERPEARTDSHEDQLEAFAGLGEELDSQSTCGQADDVDATLLVQLE